jgi:hypothetical protein
VKAVEPGRHVEGRAEDPAGDLEALGAVDRVDVFISLKAGEQDAERHGQRERLGRGPVVALAHAVVRPGDRAAREQQDQRVEERDVPGFHRMGARGQPGVALDGYRMVERTPEVRPEEGEEEQHLRGDEQRHADAQALGHDFGVMTGAALADDVAPPVDQGVGQAEHGEQHDPGAASDLVHVHEAADHQRQSREAADDRPRARLDQMIRMVHFVMVRVLSGVRRHRGLPRLRS